MTTDDDEDPTNLHRRQPTIHRTEVPVDDRWHILDLSGPVVAWGCRRPDEIDLWFWVHRPADRPRQHVLRVFGTGHPVAGAEHIEHRATLIVPGAPLVWHVLEWMGRPSDGVWPPSAGATEGRALALTDGHRPSAAHDLASRAHYFSTHCLHDHHDLCKGICKHCPERCKCDCHEEA